MDEEELRALVERIASTDLVADRVHALAEELAPEAVDAALDLATELREIDGATALALVRLAQGRTPDAATVERIYPDAIDERAAQVLIAAHPERKGILTRLLGSRRPDRYQLAMAAALYLHLHPDEAPPPVLLGVLRTLSRARSGWVGEGWAVQAVLRLSDPDLNARYRIDPKRDVLDETIFAGVDATAGVDALPATRSKVLASGFTARRASPKVGRNDPCPCGSGKKYKKCHWGKEDASLSPAAGLTMREYRLRLHELCSAEELLRQHPADLARLPLAELTNAQATACFRVFLDCERMEEAEAIVRELEGREALDEGVTIDDYRAELTEYAHEYGEDALAARMMDALSDPGVVSDHVRIGRALRRPDAETLGLLEAYARPHLVEGGRPPVSLAYELLEPYPALGILVSRGCLDPAHEADSRALLDEIEWGRDRLGAPPDDAYWGVLDRMLLERKMERASDAEKEALRAELERLREDAREARAQAHVLARELGQQRALLEELEARAADAEERAEAAKAEDDDAGAALEAEEARRLRFKIQELQGRIREGQAERADLRRRAEELASTQDDEAAAEPQTAPREDPGEKVAPHGVRVPVWSDKARASLGKLPKHIVANAIATTGALGAGRPEAWRHAKRLEGLHGLCSARVGIHHRILFRIDDEGALEVEEVVTREDLDRALAARR